MYNANMGSIVRLLLSTLTVMIAAYLVPGIVVADLMTGVIVAVVLGVVNMVIKPILHIVSLPLTIITLGLFSLVINGLMVMLVSLLVPGFEVAGILSAILFSIVVSLVGTFLNSLT